jgi:hypothetical protein
MATVGLDLFRVSHNIETTGGPVFCKARQLDPKKLFRVFSSGGGWRFPPFQLALVFSAAHCAQEGRLTAPLWRLTAVEPCHDSRQLHLTRSLLFSLFFPTCTVALFFQ